MFGLSRVLQKFYQKKHCTADRVQCLILIFNQSVDKKSAQKPYKPVFNSYKLLLDFLYTFSLKISIRSLVRPLFLFHILF